MRVFMSSFLVFWSLLSVVFAPHSAVPPSLAEIYRTVKVYADKHRHIAKLSEIGKSYEGRPIQVLEVHESSKETHGTMVVIFGVHAREWMSHMSCLFFIRILLNNDNLKRIRKKVRWFIVPVLNPDGYHYSTTRDSMWRKNRRPLLNSKCVGVDLNRNFPTGWDVLLSGPKEMCKSTYSGTKPASEPESKVLERFIQRLGKVDVFVDVHGCAQSILHPYGYTLKKPPDAKLKVLLSAAKKMKSAMEKVVGERFSVRSAAELYVAGGGLDDWAFSQMKIPLVFTLELGYDNRNSRRCFHPSNDEMTFIKRECLRGLIALAGHLADSIQDAKDTRRKGSKMKLRLKRRG